VAETLENVIEKVVIQEKGVARFLRGRKRPKDETRGVHADRGGDREGSVSRAGSAGGVRCRAKAIFSTGEKVRKMIVKKESGGRISFSLAEGEKLQPRISEE